MPKPTELGAYRVIYFAGPASDLPGMHGQQYIDQRNPDDQFMITVYPRGDKSCADAVLREQPRAALTVLADRSASRWETEASMAQQTLIPGVMRALCALEAAMLAAPPYSGAWYALGRAIGEAHDAIKHASHEG